MLSARLRAPRGDREILVRPALAEMPALVARNHEHLGRLDFAVLGESFQSVRAAARREFAGGADLVVQTGHQPTPYHPGVWIKNFLTNRLAGRVGAIPLNIIVDNDAAKHLELRVPRMRPDGQADLTRVPLTEAPPDPNVPYEECPAPSAAHLDRIQKEVTDACPDDGMREGFSQFWALVRAGHEAGQSIADLITAARHQLELTIGLANREIMISRMSTTTPFRLVLLHLLSEAPRFVAIHNRALADYRRARRIRSRANPMPDLAADGDTWELPYWVWRAGEQRARLMARIAGDGIELLRGDETVLDASRSALLHPESGPTLLDEALQHGWKIRPRALSTTIFSRLFVADAFVHGIGGAIYDQVTDRIIRDFFGVEPPAFIIGSATVRLPVGSHGASIGAVRRQRWLLRDLTYNPDRHLAGDQRLNGPFQSLVKQKWDLIGRPRGATAAERRDVFVSIRRANAAILSEGLETRMASERQGLARLQAHLAADAVLTSREYAFCLFPPGVLPAFYDEALAEITA